MRHSTGRRRLPALLALAFLLPLLAACGAGAATTAAPGGGSAGTVRAIPVDGHALAGQGRVGAPGQGAFLFFDADG